VAALLLIIGVAIWYRLGAIESYVVPTYGNTMYHVGIERLTVLTQHYPDYEISYGGGFPNFYVPAYRLLIASMSVATGIDVLAMSGLMVIVIGTMALLAMFALAYRMSDNKYVALFAAFFFVMSPDITIYTIRPFPELLGLFMVPFTLYFVVRKNWAMAIIGAALTALTHQMTLAALAAILGIYAVLLLIRAGLAYAKKKEYRIGFEEALGCVATILAACVTYGAWQLYTLGTLSLMKTNQVVYHEGNVVDLPLFLRVGTFVLIFFAIGLFYFFGKSHRADKAGYGVTVTAETTLLAFAWIVATLILMLNDRINPLIQFLNTYVGGIMAIPTIEMFPLFMDRFFTFFVMIAIIVAAFGMYAILEAMGLDVLKAKP
jgi:hypothetical protein